MTAAACAVAAGGLAYWAIWGSDSDNPRLAGIAGQTKSIEASNFVAAVFQPSSERIRVKGAGGKIVLVVAPDGRAALVVAGVKRAPQGRQFEAWVILGKELKRAGLFSGGPGYVVVPLTERVPKGATVAVTLEPTGGLDAPTSKPLFAARRA